MFQKYDKYLIIILSFIILSCVSDICLIHTHVLFSTDDMQFHLKRVMELFIDNNSSSSFAFNYFHGSSVMAMYPHYNLFLLAFALHFLSSYVQTYLLFFILIILTSLICSFFSSIRFSKSNSISYIFALLYSFSITFLVNYFHDGDLGITTSLIFLPIVTFGFLDILYNSKNFFKLSFGLTFMILCSLPTTVIVVFFLLIMCLINIDKIRKNVFYELLKSALLFVLLSSIVWVPMLKIILFNRIYTPGAIQIKGANLLSIIKNIGFIPLISIPILLFYFNRSSRIMKQIYCISIMILIFSSNFFPQNDVLWGKLSFINNFQFTARFLIIPQIILCYLSACLVVSISFIPSIHYSQHSLLLYLFYYFK